MKLYLGLDPTFVDYSLFLIIRRK